MGTLDEDLKAVKAVEDKIINNKVANVITSIFQNKFSPSGIS